MTAISMTAAIREASGYCAISGQRASWHIYGPYRDSDPHGPSTEMTADSYAKAVAIRTAWRARIALALMGRLDSDTACAVDEARHYPASEMAGTGVANLVRFALCP